MRDGLAVFHARAPASRRHESAYLSYNVFLVRPIIPTPPELTRAGEWMRLMTREVVWCATTSSPVVAPRWVCAPPPPFMEYSSLSGENTRPGMAPGQRPNDARQERKLDQLEET